MPPNLFDKLLDALGLLPFGTELRLRTLHTIWQRIQQLNQDLQTAESRLVENSTILEHAQDRIRMLAGRRDQLRRTLKQLREEHDRARSSTIQQQLARQIGRTQRALDQISDDLVPAFDQQARNESALQAA
ncbi:MAG: hypothetical protein R3330_06950, partial [Saprospiraceae bacterium]|nr:hypothetical protein [Saprospiraceae bacterium]